MGSMLVIYRIMPNSPEANLEEIKQKTQEILEDSEATHIGFKEDPVAFGLKAILANFELDESNGLDPLQNQIEAIETVSSVEVTDMRRAFG